jgi:phospholipid/cholesterol/gamma-HCH transport system substrate-binding protein
MGRKSIETLVGIFVLLGMIAVVFLALKAANLATFTAGSTYAVTARFDNIGGLKVRAPVKSAGVTVGRVRAISLDTRTYQGLVTIDLQEGMAFPADTSAKILTAGLLGDQYIGLEPGGSDKSLKAGDEIKMTQSAVVLRT